MGFFSRLMGGSDEQKTAASEFEILAPVSGELVHLEDTNDPAFSSRAVGDGVAVVPQEGTVCAPVSGTVAALFPTEHALGIMSDDSSAQVMLHIGMGVRTISWTAPRRIQASCGTPSGSATRGTS